MKKCKECGNICAEDALFCSDCGYKFEEEVKQEAVAEEVKDEVVVEATETDNENVVEIEEPIFEEKKPRIVECPTCGAVVNVDENPNCPVCGALLVDIKVEQKKENNNKNDKKSFGLATAGFILGIVGASFSATFTMVNSSYLGIAVCITAIVFGIITLAKKYKGKAMVFAIIGMALAVEGLFMMLLYPYILEPIIEEIQNELENELGDLYIVWNFLK